MLPSLDELEGGPLWVHLSEKLDDGHLFFFDGESWGISVVAVDCSAIAESFLFFLLLLNGFYRL